MNDEDEPSLCGYCDGSGEGQAPDSRCNACRGSGAERDRSDDWPDEDDEREPPFYYDGTGEY